LFVGHSTAGDLETVFAHRGRPPSAWVGGMKGGDMKAAQRQVRLVRVTPQPEEVVAAAAKLCYASNTARLLEQDPDRARKFVRQLADMGHMSPIEHVSFTFYIEGVSRAMTHQLVRHRIASYSQRSQRYVAEDGFDYVVPPELSGRQVDAGNGPVDAVSYYEDTMALIAERYARLHDAFGRTGEKSNQDARYVLPNACETKIFVTMNARELLHFFEERLCMRAQWEIRQVADDMLRLAREACRSLFGSSGPKCLRYGRCPEGKMTCGLYEEMKRRYLRNEEGDE
jgi:thymidylate synthase (FAD)